MSTDPKNNTCKRINKPSSQENALHSPKEDLINAVHQDKIILDLISKNSSPNDIVEYFWNVYRIRTYSNKIIKQLISYSSRIDKINRRFDEIASQKMKVSVIDETFKGRHIIILVFMDMVTGYVYNISWIKNRKKETILKALHPFKELCSHVEIVMTDGAPYFPDIVREIFPNAQHQTCLVHILRHLFREMEPFEKDYRKIKKERLKSKEIIRDEIEKIREKRYNLKKIKRRRRYKLQKRDELRVKYRVKPYEKNILKKHPDLREINLEINLIDSEIRSLQTTIKNNKIYLQILQIDYENQLKQEMLEWGNYMTYRRILARFYSLFHVSSKKYIDKKEILLKTLSKHPDNPFFTEIKRILETTKGLEAISLGNSTIKLSRRFINSNSVESINSRLRPILDKLRNIQDGTYLHVLFSLIKLRLNTTRPRNGLRTFNSPIERFGYDLKDRTFLDLLLHGLPPGKQSYTFCSKIDLAIASPNMSGECQI